MTPTTPKTPSPSCPLCPFRPFSPPTVSALRNALRQQDKKIPTPAKKIGLMCLISPMYPIRSGKFRRGNFTPLSVERDRVVGFHRFITDLGGGWHILHNLHMTVSHQGVTGIAIPVTIIPDNTLQGSRRIPVGIKPERGVVVAFHETDLMRGTLDLTDFVSNRVILVLPPSLSIVPPALPHTVGTGTPFDTAVSSPGSKNIPGVRQNTTYCTAFLDSGITDRGSSVNLTILPGAAGKERFIIRPQNGKPVVICRQAGRRNIIIGISGILGIREGNLLEHIHTLGFECGFPGLVQCRQQHGRQNGNDGDHHQQFNQCKRAFHFNPFY